MQKSDKSFCEMTANDDAGERLMALLAEHDVTFRANLAEAAEMAGRQLELLKPSVVAATPEGLYLGPAAMVERDTILVVVADRRRVLTVHIRRPPFCFGDRNHLWEVLIDIPPD